MNMDSISRKRTRRTRVRQVIFSTLGVAGTMAIALLAPNILSVLGKTLKRSNVLNTQSSIRRLIDAGLLERFFISGVPHVRLTPKGKLYLQTEIGHTRVPSRWDGKWRVVIFDIPEARRTLRNRLRDMLLQIGFVQLQKSVWVYPFDCEDLVTLIKKEY